MLDSLNSCMLQSSPLTNQFIKNNDIPSTIKPTIVGFYQMLTSTVGVMETWLDSVDEFIEFSVQYTKLHSNSDNSNGTGIDVEPDSNSAIDSGSGMDSDNDSGNEYAPSNRPALTELTELIAEGNCKCDGLLCVYLYILYMCL